MLKKIFIAATICIVAILAAIIISFPYLNICNAKMPPDEMYLGGLTIGSTVAEMKKIYGVPTSEKSKSCTYGDVVIFYDRSGEKIQSIIVKGSDGWTTPSGFNVGGSIRTVLNAYGSSDYSKSGDSKKVYLYFNCNKNKPEFGLAILVDESNGQILELGIYGDDSEKTFAEYYEDLAKEMVK